MTTDISSIVAFLHIVQKLGTVCRDIKNLNGEEESDCDHILKLSYLTQLVAPHLQTPVDSLKMLELALIHDLVEAECGDIPLCAQNGDTNLKELKKQNEQAAIERYREMLPSPVGDKIYNLFMEYENKTSREAQVVYALDKLEASFSACRYGDGDVRYWGNGENGDWYYRCAMNGDTPEKKILTVLEEPILNQLEAMALTNCRRAIKKSEIKLEGIFPEINYQPQTVSTEIIGFVDELEKYCPAQDHHCLSATSSKKISDSIIKLCYLVILLHPYLSAPADYDKMLHLALVEDLTNAGFDASRGVNLSEIQQSEEAKKISILKNIAQDLRVDELQNWCNNLDGLSQKVS